MAPAEETGEAFTFAIPQDAGLVRQIEKVLGSPIERRRLAHFDYAGFQPESALPRNGQARGQGRRRRRR